MKTPMIANNIRGFSQDIIDGKTGVLVDMESKNLIPAILDEMDGIRANIDAYESNIHQLYMDRWHPSNWPEHFGSVLMQKH